MAAKNWSTTSSSGTVDELLFRNDTVSLCLLVNRRNKTLRVIDFRAGPTAAKRNFVIATAQRESVEKVFTLVERDEVSTWTRLGFTREGSIPGFYKRSDAWILGAVVSQVTAVQSNARRGGDDEPDDEPDDVPAFDDGSSSPAAVLAERTIQRAKRLRKSDVERLPPVKLSRVREVDARKAVQMAQRSGRALTGFEAFGRDAVRQWYLMTSRGAFELYASWEVQTCFGNSFLELLSGPRTEQERVATTQAVRVLCEKLKVEGAVSTFTFAPSDDVGLAQVFLANGFRRSAVLARHLICGEDRKDAILWSKKLATPEA